MEAHISRLGKVLDINLRWEQMGQVFGDSYASWPSQFFPILYCTSAVI